MNPATWLSGCNSRTTVFQLCMGFTQENTQQYQLYLRMILAKNYDKSLIESYRKL